MAKARRSARKNIVRPAPGAPLISTRSPGPISTMRVVQLGAAAGRRDLEPGKYQLVLRALHDVDALFHLVQHIGHLHGGAEIRDAQQGRAEIGDAADVVDEPAQRLMHLVEGADRHHQAAKGEVARKIGRRRDDERGNHRHPAIAGGYPGEVRDRADDLSCRLQHGAKVESRSAAARPPRRPPARSRRDARWHASAKIAVPPRAHTCRR